MKDQIISLAEAVRLARLELGHHRDPRHRATAASTITRLESVLCDPKVDEALAAFGVHDCSPAIVPDVAWRETVKH